MFEKIKTLLGGMAAACVIATALQAAPVTFEVTAVSASVSGICTDGTCNMNGAGMVGALGRTETVDEEVFDGFNSFEWTALPAPIVDASENIAVTASITLLVSGISYFYEATGIMNGWSVSPAGIVTGGTLDWLSIAIPAGSPLNVAFNEIFVPGGWPNGFIRSGVTINALPSVVPLPGGAVLLLTALVGFFGLSRRRYFAAA